MAYETYLVEYESIVYKHLQNYFDKNRPFDLNEIIPYLTDKLAKSSININRNGIKKIIASLVKQKLIVKGSSLTRDKVLDLEKRKIIYDFVRLNPGAYFNRIVKELGFPNHIVTWHLNTLVKFQFLKSDFVDAHDIYFEPNVDISLAVRNYYLSKKKCKIIINYLKGNDIGFTKTRLAEILKIHPKTASKYIDILVAYNFILEEKRDKILYFFNPEANDILNI